MSYPKKDWQTTIAGAPVRKSFFGYAPHVTISYPVVGWLRLRVDFVLMIWPGRTVAQVDTGEGEWSVPHGGSVSTEGSG